MASSVPIHYSVRYYRLASNYLSGNQKEQIIKRYKGYYLSFAETLFINGNLLEAWYYYYELNKVSPLTGKHLSLFEFSERFRLKNIDNEYFLEYYDKWPFEMAIPYGLFLLKKDAAEEIKEIISNTPKNKQNTIGIFKLELLLKVKLSGLDKKDLEALESFKNELSSQVEQLTVFQKLEKQRVYDTILNLYFVCSSFLEKTEEKLAILRNEVKQNLDFLNLDNIPLYSINHKKELDYLYNKLISINKDMFFTEAEKELHELPKINYDFSFTNTDFAISPSSNRKISETDPSSSFEVEDNDCFESSLLFYEFITCKKFNTNLNEKEVIKIEESLFENYESVSNALLINSFSKSALNLTIRFKALMHQLPFIQSLINISKDNEAKNDLIKLKKRWGQLRKTSVFISHSTKDIRSMEMIKEKLDRHNINTIVDSDIIKAGMKIQDELKKAINNSDKVVLLVSFNSLTSGWVGFEIDHFINLKTTGVAKKNIELIPIVIDKTFLDNEFETSLRKKVENELKKIKSAIKERLVESFEFNELKERGNRQKVLNEKLSTIIEKIQEYNTIYIFTEKEVNEKTSDLLNLLAKP